MMNEKGAVPVSYIIALLLGIAVIGITGYWFFFLGGEWGGEVTLSTCRSRAYTYCANWQAVGYSNAEDCEPDVGWFDEKYPRCKQYDSALGFSNKILCEDNSYPYRGACETIISSEG